MILIWTLGGAGTNNVVLAGVNNLDFLIDTNNNGTTGAFVFGTNATTMSAATQLMTLDESGHLDLKTGNYKVNGTTVIDSSRNLHNIGTFNGKLSVSLSSSHTTGTISSSNAALDLYNPLEADTDEKGTIITFSDNYYDGNYNKTTRAAIKGGTDTTGNTANGFLAFYTDSGGANTANERARFDSSGNFGIGTTSPADKLHVDGRVRTSTSGIALSDTNAVIYRNSNDLELITYGGFDINLMPSNNVGIGTTSPNRKLEVLDNILIGGASGANLYFRPNNSFSSAGNFGIFTTALTSGTFESTMTIKGYGSGVTDVMTIKGLGNVGIGTTSPAANLHVESSAPEFRLSQSGTAKVRLRTGGDNYINTGQKLGIGTTSPDTKLDITSSGVNGVLLNQDTSNAAASARLLFKDQTRTNAILNVNGNLELRTGATIGSSSGTKRLVVNGNGNVGIGDNAAPSRQFTVYNTSHAVMALTAGTSSLAQLALGDTGDDNYAQILLDNSTNKLQIQNGGGGAIGDRGITLDSSENVGIGQAIHRLYYM